VRRPSGQLPGEGGPVFGPTRELDFELELGIFVGVGNRLGEPVPLERAWDLIFGFCIVNDWSARDIQRWEYQPLGPFLGKNFATTISPWVVLSDALEPYRTAAYRRPDGDPRPLAYLWNEGDQQRGGLDITMEAWLTTKEMRHRELAPQLLCRTSTRWLYWTPAQMVAHHTSNGCNLRPGDLLATGTVSGPEERERACLLEITNNGREPIQMPTGEQRCYLEDGDEVILRAFCRQEGLPVISFGEARAIIEG
jgi:fumarylacetoacetase